MSIAIPELHRRQMRQQMLAAGLPAAVVDEAVGLGRHAAARGLEALLEVVERASHPGITLAAGSIAAGYVSQLLDNTIRSMSEKVAGSPGGVVIHAHVGPEA